MAIHQFRPHLADRRLGHVHGRQGMNMMRRKEAEKPADPPAPTPEEKLLTEIRDLLNGRANGAPLVALYRDEMMIFQRLRSRRRTPNAVDDEGRAG